MDDTASLDRDGRFTACLERLEELKAIKARREVLEERVFLEFLRANGYPNIQAPARTK